MPPGLLVMGDIITDVIARPKTALNFGTDTAADVSLRPGGSGSNTAAWAAWRNASVRLLARAGSDSADWHLSALTAVGVEPRLVVDPDRPTAMVIALISAEGERTMITDRGAGAHISRTDWDDSLLDGIAHLHISGYLLFVEAGRQVVAAALAAAMSRGVTTSVDPASTSGLNEFGIDRFLAETQTVDLLFPNLDEVCLLSGELDPKQAAEKMSQHYRQVVVTLGGDGAIAADSGRAVCKEPAEPAEIVDLVGAGDAFNGGFLAAYLAGADLASATESGCHAAAEAVTIIGGRPPTRI